MSLLKLLTKVCILYAVDFTSSAKQQKSKQNDMFCIKCDLLKWFLDYSYYFSRLMASDKIAFDGIW
jgi:hypothetical protein